MALVNNRLAKLARKSQQASVVELRGPFICTPREKHVVEERAFIQLLQDLCDLIITIDQDGLNPKPLQISYAQVQLTTLVFIVSFGFGCGRRWRLWLPHDTIMMRDILTKQVLYPTYNVINIRIGEAES